MSQEIKKIPRKYQPHGFEILYEDRDVIVGNKAEGVLTVSALYDKENTVHRALNLYVRKGNSKLRTCVYVVHRLDRETSGILIFAKTEKAQIALKDDWKNTEKIYYAVVHGRMPQPSGVISSYLTEDDDYVVHSDQYGSREGKLARTGYEVVKATNKFSLLKVNLLTGRKNQIRVHFADEGHPVVGDKKYGTSSKKYERLTLHSQKIAFSHPFSGKRMIFESPIPEYFTKLLEPVEIVAKPKPPTSSAPRRDSRQ